MFDGGFIWTKASSGPPPGLSFFSALETATVSNGEIEKEELWDSQAEPFCTSTGHLKWYQFI